MKFWYSKQIHVFAWLLLPLSALIWIVSSWKRWRRNQNAYPVPVIVVGNLTVGGTGKTPTIIWLAELLKKHGHKVAIVSRGYQAKPNRPFPVELLANDSATSVGDEPKLMSNKTDALVVIDPDRNRAVEYCCALPQEKKPTIIISDDGLQHYRMHRDIEMIMIDAQRGLGNKLLLPAGPLRESSSRLTSSAIVLAKESGPEASEYDAHVAELASKLAINADGEILPKQSVRLISAIGNSESFVRTAGAVGYTVAKQIDLKDHAAIPLDLLSVTDLPILVTEKDFVKLENPPAHVFYLPFELTYSSFVEDLILQKLQDCTHEKSHHHSSTL